MKIRNDKYIQMISKLIIIILALLFIFFISQILNVIYLQSWLRALILTVFFALLFKLLRIRSLFMEVTEHVISISHKRLFAVKKIRIPQLEVPLEKIISCNMNRYFLNYFLAISIDTKNGTKTSYYNLGMLSKRGIGKFQNAIESIKNHKSYDSGL